MRRVLCSRGSAGAVVIEVAREDIVWMFMLALAAVGIGMLPNAPEDEE